MTKIGYHKLSVNGQHYLYDTSTNDLLRVDPVVHGIFDDYFKYDRETLKKASKRRFAAKDVDAGIEFIDQVRDKRGMFQPYFPKDFSGYLDKDFIRESQRRQLRHLMLSITEQCNQRCSYCVYSGKYKGRRTHADRYMTWDVAHRSIAYFLRRTRKKGGSAITFYGGEPLLHWKLLKKSIAYIRKQQDSNKLTVSIGTNATLVTDEIIDFAIANDVVLFISLDGPEKVHNAARKYRNGKGTHKKVIDTLQRIRMKNYEFFDKRVIILSTVDVHNNLLEVVQYFNTPAFKDLSVRLRPIRDLDTVGYRVSDENRHGYEKGLDDIIDRYLASYYRKSPFNYSLIYNLFLSVFKHLSGRAIELAEKMQRPNRVCIPGVSQLFVSADGVFYACNHFCNPGLDIGNYRTGIDVAKAHKLLEIYVQYCDEMCQKCWAYRLCRQCFVHLLKRGRISKSRKQEHCLREKQRIVRDLQRFIYIRENEPDVALDNKFSLRSRIRRHPVMINQIDSNLKPARIKIADLQ